MTTYRLWPGGMAAETPPNNAANDGATYTLGNQFRVSAACQLTGAYWWRPPLRDDGSANTSDTKPQKVGVFDADTQTLIATAEVFDDPGSATGEIKHTFATPIDLDASHIYRLGIYGGGQGFYAATHFYWTSGPGASGIDSGILHGDSDAEAVAGSGGQDSFSTATSDIAYPDGSFQGSNYWIDPEVTVPHLVVAYDFDAGTGSTVSDASGNGHDLPLPATGPPTWDASGHTNSGISDDGTSGSGDACGLDEADWSTWLPIGRPITSMCWAKLHTDTNAIIISMGVDSGYSGNFDFYYLTDVHMGIYMSVSGSTYTIQYTWTPDDVWHHWAATCDGQTLKLLLDGVVVDSTAVPGFPEFADTGNFMIGLAYPTFNSIGMDGVIDDVRIYDAALTADQITTCMDVAVGTQADPLSGGPGPVTGTADFSGTGALTATGSPSFTGSAGFAGSGTLSETGTPHLTAAATLAGSGTLTTPSAPAFTVPATLAGTGSLGATGTPAFTGSAALSGSGSLSATGAPAFTRAAGFSGSGSLGVTGAPIFVAAVGLSGSGALVAAGSPILARIVSFSGTGTLTAVGIAVQKVDESKRWHDILTGPLIPQRTVTPPPGMPQWRDAVSADLIPGEEFE
jgi:hypothetical protein